VPAGRLIVSAPLPAGQASTAVSVLAAWMASRSEQSPSLFGSSSVVVTAMVVAAKAGREEREQQEDCGMAGTTDAM